MALKTPTELDFDIILNNLKEHLKSQDEFKDWDFEGSGVTALLRVLAYTTQQNAMLAHMQVNEGFLGSAQIRSSVVGHAERLSYLPRPAKASEILLDITVNAPVSNPPQNLVLPRSFPFSTAVGDEDFVFYTEDETIGTLENGLYIFNEVKVIQGERKTFRYRVDAFSPTQRFTLPDTFVDVSRMVVNVFDSELGNDFERYLDATDVLNVDGQARVYFLTEDGTGRYQIRFGDGVLGRSLTEGQYVEADYLITDGTVANGATRFSANNSVNGLAVQSVSPSEDTPVSSGGQDPEDIDEVRLNAPQAFTTRSRAVTAQDYRTTLLTRFPELQDIVVWGGEDNDPPVYGAVFIAATPEPSENKKKEIIKFLKDRNMVTVSPKFVQNDTTDLNIEVVFKHNPNLSNRTQSELETLVRQTVVNFVKTNLNRYDNVVRYSNLLSAIDNTAPEILNSAVYAKMSKTFTPSPNVSRSYEIRFANAIFSKSLSEPVLESSDFLYNGVSVFLSNDKDRVDLLLSETGQVFKRGVGEIRFERGVVSLDAFEFQSSAPVEVMARPMNFDLFSVLNRTVSVQETNITARGTVDTIALFGQAGVRDFQPTPQRL